MSFPSESDLSGTIARLFVYPVKSCAGIEVQQVYPVPPLIANQVVSIGITSYNGTVYIGLNADRDGMWDVISMTEFLYEALDEIDASAKGE